MSKTNKNGLVTVNAELVKSWKPALEAYIGVDALKEMSGAKQKALVGMAAAAYENLTGKVAVESGFAFLNGANSTMAPNVVNPIAGGHAGGVAQPGTKGSGDKMFLMGVCIAIAAKTIGLELVQTVPTTSQNVTIRNLEVRYNGGDLGNAANRDVHVITLYFDQVYPDGTFAIGTEYVIGHKTNQDGTAMEFLKVKYAGIDRVDNKAHVFILGDAFSATVADEKTLSDITIYGTKPAVAAVVADGAFYAINANMTEISDKKVVKSVENTKAIENYIPHQTTKGYSRTLTRSEADAGTDHSIELDLNSEAYTIGNRVFTANISRLNYKRLEEEGYDSIGYLTAASKNEIAQEVNYQIVSACRSYGITNALDLARRGTIFNTYIGPESVNEKAFAAIAGADQLLDKDGNPVASQFPAVQNLMKTMRYETVASIGTYLAMLIKQACYVIGTDSRFGEGDAVVLAAGLAGYLEASSVFTKLADKDADMSAGTGAKLSGHLNGIKVYVDVQIPANCPFVTVLRTNQDVKVDMPGIDGDNILIPGLVYLVKDLISTTELLPEGTGGKKLIIDSATDLIPVGDRPEAGYITFAFDCNLPGLSVTAQ